MINQVLSIDQCKELVALGLDMSDASMFWRPAFYRANGILDYDRYEDNPRIKLENNYNLEYDIPTFTFQDILQKLPNNLYHWCVIDTGGSCILIEAQTDSEGFRTGITKVIHKTYSKDNPFDAAFEMLKWCKQNNHI